MLNNKKIHVVSRSSCQSVTGIVVNEKVQVNSKYRNRIRQEVYYIKKYGLGSHLDRCGFKGDKSKYLDKLYGRILYVLQINKDDKEFINYKEFIINLKN